MKMPEVPDGYVGKLGDGGKCPNGTLLWSLNHGWLEMFAKRLVKHEWFAIPAATSAHAPAPPDSERKAQEETQTGEAENNDGSPTEEGK